MSKRTARVREALRRGVARADTVIAAVTLFFAGWRAGDERWISAAVLAVIGVVFLVASGDFVWRRGFAAGKRSVG